MMVSNPPKVSVIVPVYNAAKALPRLVSSLQKQSYPRELFEIILVDNNSTDGSREVAAVYKDVISISQTRWQTPGATRNAGVSRATGEICAFIDADCWAHADWLMNGIRTLTEKNLDRVAGRVDFVLRPKPNIFEIYDSSINFRQTDFVSSGWCGTGNFFVPRSIFEDVGPFDPELVSCEDCEFGLRATKAGKTLGYAPDAVIYHDARRSMKSLFTKWVRTEYGAAQAWKRHGLLELHLWTKKANYRPLHGIWRTFPEDVQSSFGGRMAVDCIANVLRFAGNLGSFLGDVRTKKGDGK